MQKWGRWRGDGGERRGGERQPPPIHTLVGLPTPTVPSTRAEHFALPLATHLSQLALLNKWTKVIS